MACSRARRVWWVSVLLVLCAPGVSAVKKSDFRTCAQSSFCTRSRLAPPEGSREFVVDPNSFSIGWDSVAGELAGEAGVPLELNVTVLVDDILHVRIIEKQKKVLRYDVQDVVQWEKVERAGLLLDWKDDRLVLQFGQCEASIFFKPFRLVQECDGELVFDVNGRNLMHFEHYREKPQPVPAPEPPEDAPESVAPPDDPAVDLHGMWEEEFNTHRDTKPKGPQSVGMDFLFATGQHAYGVPEHADSFVLRPTVAWTGKDADELTVLGDPYRLFNLDVFEYELDSRMALYGSVPFMISHGKGRTSGVFWLNAAETWVDVEAERAEKRKKGSEISRSGVWSHWISESGALEFFLLPGPTPAKVFDQYTRLSGRIQLPQVFAIMYHQCRWNYKSQDDVLSVHDLFDEWDIPVDAVWLDIEHTDAKKYFTWDSYNFPDSVHMQRELMNRARRMITIVDPHIKKDTGYHIYSEALANKYFVMKADGGVYEGHCWPGASCYLDFLNPDVRNWWAEQYDPSRYAGILTSTYTWNDMQEPSVFNGPEISLPRDAVHANGFEHRDVHNQYGFYVGMSTFEGQLRRTNWTDRPFILSRAMFAGSQRFGAVWTGDNIAEWSHLRATVPMLLSLGVAAETFSGADVAGFFGDPDAELFVRWYQAAAYQPFFRGHAHLDTKRREPWSYDEQTTKLVRQSIRQRYELLPYWYTKFREAHESGMPVMRPLWVEFPSDTETWKVEDEWMLGEALLVAPVMTQGASVREVYLPRGLWFEQGGAARVFKGPNKYSLDVELSSLPVFQRAGTIVPKKERVRRAASLMEHDPVTLVVVPTAAGYANGRLYVDDGHSLDFELGAFHDLDLSYSGGVLAGTMRPYIEPELEDSCPKRQYYETHGVVGRIVVRGVSRVPRAATVIVGKSVSGESMEGASVLFDYDKSSQTVVLRKPNVSIARPFKIKVSWT